MFSDEVFKVSSVNTMACVWTRHASFSEELANGLHLGQMEASG